MNGSDKTLKRLVWLYFALLIGEGALRKWVAPSLSGPLLIVRDPVVLSIYALAAGRGMFRMNGFLAFAVALAALGFVTSFFGRGTLLVTAYGLRADFLHLPLVFLLPRIFTADDVRWMGRVTMLLTVPMALLAVAQFRAGPDSWLNTGAGGELGGQIFAAEGKIRPPGTFSFVNGMVAFLAMSAAFLLESFFAAKPGERLLRMVVLPALLLALAVSGSRDAVVTTSVVVVSAVVVCVRLGSKLRRALLVIMLAYMAFLALGTLSDFNEGIGVVKGRFDSSGGVHEGIVRRYFGDLMGAFDAASVAPLLGFGIGVGTNAGAGLISGERAFLLAEGEWARVVLEGGVVLGFAFIILRIALVLHIGRVALRALHRGNMMPTLLLGACFFNVMAGKYGQPAECGFAMLVAGLALAAVGTEDDAPPGSDAPEPPPEKQAQQGRAPYAETLHRRTDA
jgi:hypothetical protein